MVYDLCLRMCVCWLSGYLFFSIQLAFTGSLKGPAFFFGSGHVHEYFLVPVCLRDIFLKNTPIPQK